MISPRHSPQAPVIGWIADLAERQLVASSHRQESYWLSLTADEILSSIAAAHVDAIVLELSGTSARVLEQIVDAVRRADRPMTLTLRFHAQKATSAMIARQTACLSRVRLSLRGFDELNHCGAQCAKSAMRWQIWRRTLELQLPELARHLLLTATIAGERVTSVPEFASICGLAPRTAETQLKRFGLVGAKQLLSVVFSLHAAWLIGQGNAGTAEIAHQLGCASERSLKARISRTTGFATCRLRNVDAFSELIERLPLTIMR
jgi:hypothetical protein